MFENHLVNRVAEQDDVLIERFDSSLQLYSVH
jgi:hypothetical protein